MGGQGRPGGPEAAEPALAHPRSTGRARRRWRSLLVVLFWLLVWQALAWAVHSQVLLASPVEVASSLVRLVPTAGFWSAIGFSAGRILAGFFLALAAGALLAVAGSAWPVVAALLSPLMRVLQAVPVVSFVLLVLVWTGSGGLATVVSFVMVTPIVYVGLLAGLADRDPRLAEMARVFRLGPARRWWAITLPGLMPSLTAAVRIGLGLTWKAGVSAEVIGLTSGSIGERLYQAKLFLATGDLFAWTAVIVALAWLVERAGLAGLRALDRRLGRMYGQSGRGSSRLVPAGGDAGRQGGPA